MELLKDSSLNTLIHFVKMTETIKKQFLNIGYEFGEERAEAYIQSLMNKLKEAVSV